MMTKADRARRHYGVAKWMESHHVTAPADVDRIAHHYATAATLIDELGYVSDLPDEIQDSALMWLDRAVSQAEAGELYPVVEKLCTHALELRRVPREQRERFLLARSKERINVRDLEGAAVDVDAMMQSATAAHDDLARAAALTTRGDLEQKIGDLEHSLTTLEEAVGLYRAVGNEEGLAEALRAYGMTRMFANDSDGATASFSEALDLYRSHGNRRGEAWALQNLAWVAYTNGDAGKAEEWLNESVQAFTEIRDSGGLGWATGLLAFVHYHQGRHAEAEAMAQRMYLDASQRGDRWAEGMMRNLLAMLGLWGGRLAESVPHGEAAYKLFMEMRDWYGEMISAGVLGRSLLAVGRVDEGFAVLDQSIRRAGRAIAQPGPCGRGGADDVRGRAGRDPRPFGTGAADRRRAGPRDRLARLARGDRLDRPPTWLGHRRPRPSRTPRRRRPAERLRGQRCSPWPARPMATPTVPGRCR